MKRLWDNYNLSITLFFLFLFSWIGQLYYQWNHFISEQETHLQETQISDFINEFGQATLENWQSEFLQLFTFVVLTTYLIHKNSHESRDSDDEVKAKLENIEAMLKKTIK